MTDLRELLQEIYETRGRLTPEIVVEEARDTKHPLHSRVFDLAPPDAAEAWYRHRAHELIQTARITYKEGPLVQGRAFIAVRTEEPGSFVYEPAEKVAVDPLLRDMVLRDMEREWRSLHRRYEQFAEFTELVRSTLGLTV